MKKTRRFFTRVASVAVWATGHPYAFVAAVAVLAVWAITGPIFDYSDTWQLIINTGTSVATFLMVFLLQNSQNRDTKALHLKLDELIRTTEGAHTVLLDLEELEQGELDAIREKYADIARRARIRLRNGESDTDKPEVKIDEGELD